MRKTLESLDLISLFIMTTFFINYLFTSYLKLRQIRKIRVDKESKYLSPEEFEKVKSYNLEKLYFSIVNDLVKLVVDCGVIAYKLLPSGLAMLCLPYSVLNQALFYALYSIVLDVIDIPFSLFYCFYIEAKHGFNTMTPRIFATDFLKNTVLSSVINMVSFSAVLWIMSRFVSFYFYVFFFIVVFQIFMMLIYPDYVQPLFNRFEELDEGPLKDEIRKLADKLQFRVKKILKMDGSTRSHHSNAYFTGLFREKRIVIFDTLMNKAEDRQILAVLCHEFGHAKYLHLPKQLGMFIVAEFVYLYIFNLVTNLIKEENIVKIIYFLFMSSAIDIPLKLVANTMRRRWERQADGFAVQMGYGKDLGSALVKLHKDNKEITCPDTLYSMINYSHPTLEERLVYIECEMKKSE